MLTVKQAAERLQVSIGAIYHACADFRLAHVRIGRGRGTIRIREQDLEKFINACVVEEDLSDLEDE
jgi:excisionase family DNA binding protein